MKSLNFKNPFYITILLTLLVFLTDKLFLLPPIKKISLYYKKVEIFFYESRQNLYDYFNEINHDNTLSYALILGSSRSGMFSQKDFLNEVPYDVKIFNFSAPLAGTSFYYYWLYKFIYKTKNFPKFILLELDAVNLGNPSLRISLPYFNDPVFMLKHMDFYRDIPENIKEYELSSYLKIIFNNKNSFYGFSADEVDSFFIRYVFVIARYNIHPYKIWENFKTIEYFDEQSNQIKKIPLYEFAERTKIKNLENFKHTLGGIPIEFYTVVPEKDLKNDAEKNFLRFLPRPELSTSQLIFLKKILDLAYHYNIPLIIYKPPMTEYANNILIRNNLYYLDLIINEFYKYKNVLYIDTSNLNCNKFSDSVHLSPECYKDLTRFIFSNIKRKFINY